MIATTFAERVALVPAGLADVAERAARRREAVGTAGVLPWRPVAVGLGGAVVLGLAAGLHPLLGVALAAAVVLAVVSVRRPAFALWAALVSTVFAPQYYEALLGQGSAITRGHRLVVLAALAPILLARGLRDRVVPLPVLAYLALLGLTFTGVDRHPGLTFAKAGFALTSLAIGWLATQIRWRRSEAETTLLVIAFLPVLSVVLGGVLDAAGIHPLHMAEYTGVQRLQGASIPAYFGFLAAAGSAGATALLLLPGASPTGNRRRVGWAVLAIVASVVCAGLSSTRGALIATVVIASPVAVRLVRMARREARARRAFVIGALALAGLVAVLPTLIERTKTSSTNDDLDTSGRAEAWTFYVDAMDGAVLAGKGIGAGPVIGEASFGLLRGDFRGTHNEYVRLFVEGGWVGVVLVVGAAAVHLRSHVRRTPPYARAGARADRHLRRLLGRRQHGVDLPLLPAVRPGDRDLLLAGGAAGGAVNR